MRGVINNQHIDRIIIDHSNPVVKTILNNNQIYTLEEIDQYIKEIKDMISAEYSCDVSYLHPVALMHDFSIENILYLLRLYGNSLAKEVSLQDITLNSDGRFVVRVKNRILFEKFHKMHITTMISKKISSVYKSTVSLLVEFDDSVIVEKRIDFDKELGLLVQERQDINLEKSIKNEQNSKKICSDVILGKKINDSPVPISEVQEIEGLDYVLKGEIILLQNKNVKKDLNICQIDITDYEDSLTLKAFLKKQEAVERINHLKNGDNILVKGKMNYDSFLKEYILSVNHINKVENKIKVHRLDSCLEKRVELHLHSKMSAMDGISDFGSIAKRAKEWGHKAIAITDHGVLQSFPDAMEAAKKNGLKVLYGMEGYLVHDGVSVIKQAIDMAFDGDFVVFDLETTGLSPIKDKIIEIGAVKIRNYEIIETFNMLVNPEIPIPFKISELTGITDQDVMNAVTIDIAIHSFLDFIGDVKVLCAHNASFDYSFLRVNLNTELDVSILDTLELSRYLIKNKKSHKLNKLCEYFDISLDNHHRASDDAKATGEILIKLLNMLVEKGVNNIIDINSALSSEDTVKNSKTYHIILLVKNEIGLKNLYKLVSKSHMEFFYKKPRIPKSLLLQHREGLIFGSACQLGELYDAILKGASSSDLDQMASLYDFIEIQPLSNNAHLLRNGILKNEQDLIDINLKLIDIGKRNGKIICATGDVHYLDPKDSIAREILMYGQGYADAEDQAPLHLKSTDEMKNDFYYLDEALCHEVVVKGPNQIADMVDDGLLPIPNGTFPPVIPGAEENLRQMATEKAYSCYGDPLPQIVAERLEKELNSIISNGYAVMYIIAQKLVEKSLLDGYIVGSRGSVGSSFVATMSSITEVNPLPPHYICRNCKHSEFIVDGSVGSGVDLPKKKCPICGSAYDVDGHDIPFEVFLGFEGEKEPDIDLNFAAKEQNEAMKYSEELFGEGYVFRAGTIGTIASKTAYGFVKNYYDDKNIRLRNAEANRLVELCTGIKRTTGQHPGGVMIVPKNKEIYDFTPIQYPANNKKSGVTTTHFDYHSISGRILKLDILGHDTPTIMRMLEDLSGTKHDEVPLNDAKVLSLFQSPEAIGLTKEDINCDTGTLGIPEFGTGFVRQMLLETKPKTFSDLVRISGLSHGTDVWINNAQEYIKNGTTTIKDVISTRDDIMTFLIYQGLDKKRAFDIMERVRKGKGLREEDADAMKNAGVPQWYIDSCNKIKYMFPKAHAVAYVTMSVKIAYYKIYFPLAFYASYFTMKAADFDADLIVKGEEEIKKNLRDIQLKEIKSQKDKNLTTVLEVALEMYKRGYAIDKIDLYESDHLEFKIRNNKLLPPFISLQGLGENAALNIKTEREKADFISIEDLVNRAKINKTCIEFLKNHGCLEGLNLSNQISLFSV